MADITVTAASVAEYNAVTGFNLIRSRKTAADLTAGHAVSYNTSGNAALTDADSTTLRLRQFDGIVLETKASGRMARVLEEGWVYGYDLSGLSYGDKVYLSATPGALATAGDANGATEVGWVDWRTDGATPTKVLRVQRSAAGNVGAPLKRVVITVPSGATIHAAASGIVNLFVNPEAGSILITRAVLVVTTPSSGACTVDIGTNTTTLTTSDNLIDGLSVAAAGAFDNTVSGGTNGKGGQVLATGKFVTLDEASGDATGLVATFILEYIVL
jgi:hypothetical protein